EGAVFLSHLRQNAAGHWCRNVRRLGIAERQTAEAANGKIGPGLGFHGVAIESDIFGGADPGQILSQSVDDRRISAPAATNDPSCRMLGNPIARSRDGTSSELHESGSTVPGCETR